jgi:hypothetical protein
VNAFYDPTENRFTILPGIAHGSYFGGAAAPAAHNFGALGWVIGHEMTHGFDDSGRMFDARGADRDWWSPASEAAFNASSSPPAKRGARRTAPLTPKTSSARTSTHRPRRGSTSRDLPLQGGRQDDGRTGLQDLVIGARVRRDDLRRDPDRGRTDALPHRRPDAGACMPPYFAFQLRVDGHRFDE